jgi:hypothetical protein
MCVSRSLGPDHRLRKCIPTPGGANRRGGGCAASWRWASRLGQAVTGSRQSPTDWAKLLGPSRRSSAGRPAPYAVTGAGPSVRIRGLQARIGYGGPPRR